MEVNFSMPQIENVLYLGKTYYFNKTQLYDEKLTCIGDTMDDVIDYFHKIRHIQVVDEDSIGEITDDRGIVAMIVAASFPDKSSMMTFLESDERYLYILTEYGKIDRKIAGIKKRDARNVKIPAIVSQLIDSDCAHFIDELKCASHTLKNFLYYQFGFDTMRIKMDIDGKAIMRVCDNIDAIASGKDDMDIEIYKRHPILFCSEEEYRSRVSTYIGMKRMDSEYRYKLYSED